RTATNPARSQKARRSHRQRVLKISLHSRSRENAAQLILPVLSLPLTQLAHVIDLRGRQPA
ncbi:MAG TPA: hypothetical protein VIM62_01840, partial [Acidobacteriaceae bacterium]